MKIRLIFILSVLVLPLFAGCIKDDRSGCPPAGNVTILFRYPGKDGVDRFKNKIESVVIAVFDETEWCVYTRTINKSSLERLQGDLFYLSPGNYRVVCWGNLSEHSQLFLTEGTLFDQAYLALETGTPKQTSDPVMYAPRPASLGTRNLDGNKENVFRLTIPAEGEVTETTDFVSAHTQFNVIVRGLSDMSGGTNVAPKIEITELPAGYTFEMKARGGTETYQKSSEYVAGSKGPEARALFYSGNFEEKDPVTVKLFSGVDGRLLKDVNLSQYLIANLVDFSTMLERLITVLIEFEGGEAKVTVSVSAWTGTGVSPGW